MAYIYDLVDNWNNAGVTFTAIKMNVTDSASDAGSLLMDLQVGGASRFNVNKTGAVNALADGSAAAPSLRLGATEVHGFYRTGGSSMGVSLAGALTFSFASVPQGVGFRLLGNDLGIGFGATSDLLLTRRAAASLRLGAADTSASATITVTIASPGVVTWSSHNLTTGTPVVFSTTGALPTGITAGTTYYVIPVATSTFQLATSFANALAGTAVNTSGSQSGTHTGRRGAIAQTLGVQDTLSTGSLENINGADFVIRGSRGIGNKPGGSIVFQVAPAGSSGTAQNALATALTIAGSNGQVFINSSATSVAGHLIITGPSNNPATITSASQFRTGSISIGSDLGSVTGIASDSAFASGTGFRMSSVGVVSWSDQGGAAINGSASNADLVLTRDASNTLAQRRGNNGQTFRLYGRFTDITNSFERFFISAPTANGSAVLVGTQKGATTGSARAIEFQTDSVTRMTIANTGAISITSSLNVANTVSAPNINSLTSIIAPMLGAL